MEVGRTLRAWNELDVEGEFDSCGASVSRIVPGIAVVFLIQSVSSLQDLYHCVSMSMSMSMSIEQDQKQT